MLIRLIYVSKAVDPQSRALTDSILRHAHAWNTQNDITGVLCEGQGMFLQALEGERGPVTRLYARIAADPRHGHVELLADGPVARREFADWHMSFVPLTPSRFAGVLGYLSPGQLLRRGQQTTVQQVLREFLEAGADYPVG